MASNFLKQLRLDVADVTVNAVIDRERQLEKVIDVEWRLDRGAFAPGADDETRRAFDALITIGERPAHSKLLRQAVVNLVRGQHEIL
jgi:hypothetical protein